MFLKLKEDQILVHNIERVLKIAEVYISLPNSIFIIIPVELKCQIVSTEHRHSEEVRTIGILQFIISEKVQYAALNIKSNMETRLY